MARTFILHAFGRPAGRFIFDPSRLGVFLTCGRHDLITIDDGYRECHELSSEWFERWKAKTVLFLVAGRVGMVNDWDQDGEVAGRKLLEWKEIVELQKSGVMFGSHSLTHCDLRKQDDAALLKEVSYSKKLIEDKLGVRINWFAYPYGYFDQRVIEAVKEAGYTRAFTTCDSLWAGMGDPYRTRRIEISGWDSDRMLKAKISGLYDLKNLWDLPGMAAEKIRKKRSLLGGHPSTSMAKKPFSG